MKKNNKKSLYAILATIGLIAITIGITYAFVSMTLTGTKKVTITAGTLSLVLDEKNEITISDALPMYDAVGMIQEKVFNFDLINNTKNQTDYVLKLSKVSTGNELSTSDVKYYLTKDGVGTPALLSTLTSGVIDSGTINGSQTIAYTLRLWIDSGVTDESRIVGKSLSYKLVVEASMTEESTTTLVDALGLKSKVKNQTIDFAQASSDTNGKGIYKYTEDGEDIYYWRGAVEDNHVLFAGFCWEAVRTTKNGGLKMIYDGLPVDGKCTNNGIESMATSLKRFNEINYVSSNAYLGYMYGMTEVTTDENRCVRLADDGTAKNYPVAIAETSCESVGGKWATTAYEATHANVVDSLAKKAVDEWFSNSTLNTESNLAKIEDAVYCNNREITSGNGTGVNMSEYSAGYRFSMNQNPILECVQPNDRFTVSSENGNGDLTYPVGLLTSDETVLAGAANVTVNTDFYLNNYNSNGSYEPFWTMTPALNGYNGGSMTVYPYVFAINANNISMDKESLSSSGISTAYIRPVITLASTTQISGIGTETSPYQVK